MTNSKIEWTTHTFNPWRGCTKVAAGCTHCYAEATSKRNPGTLGIWGPNGTRVVASEAMWKEPLKWNDRAEANQQWYATYRSVDAPRPRVFCASLADVFEEWQGNVVSAGKEQVYLDPQTWRAASGKGRATLDDVRRRLFTLIDDTPNLDWLLLTKRPENIRRMLPAYSYHACETGDCPHDRASDCNTEAERKYRDNLWLGTSVATHADADRNIPLLLKCRDLAKVLFVSAEPLLGHVDFTSIGDIAGEHRDCLRGNWRRDDSQRVYESNAPRIDWLIVGGESGHNARPCNIEWIRSIRDQCAAAGVPCFIKQLGSQPWDTTGCDLKDSKGGDWDEWTEDLRVRQFPKLV